MSSAGSDKLRTDAGVAGLFQSALENPSTHRWMVVLLTLDGLAQDVFLELRELGLDPKVLDEGLMGPEYQRWLAASDPNDATRWYSVGVVMFGRKLAEAQQAFSAGDPLGSLFSLASWVTPPFKQKPRPGGRPKLATPEMKKALQILAEEMWRHHPRLSKEQVAKGLYSFLSPILEREGKSPMPRPRTIRRFLMRPAWAKPGARNA